MKIFYAHKAIDDLSRLHDFIAKNNPKAAAEISERVLYAVNRLKDFPMMGRKVQGHNTTDTLRDLVTGKYLIRYLLLKNEIHILRLWHGKEDLL